MNTEITKLPEWDEAHEAWANNTADPIEEFIYEYEPGSWEDTEKFRGLLLKLIVHVQLVSTMQE